MQRGEMVSRVVGMCHLSWNFGVTNWHCAELFLLAAVSGGPDLALHKSIQDAFVICAVRISMVTFFSKCVRASD